MARIGYRPGGDLLAELGSDTTIDESRRFKIATILARSGDSRGLALLNRHSANTRLHCARARELLVEFGDPRGRDLLRDIISDTNARTSDRVFAVQALARLGEPPALELLHDLATVAQKVTKYGDHKSHLYAARALAEYGDPRGVELLYSTATADPSGFPEHRFFSRAEVGEDAVTEAAMMLGNLGDPRASDLLHNFATNTSFHELNRVFTAQALARLGDRRGMDLLRTFATRSSDEIVSVQAAHFLGELTDAHEQEEMRELLFYRATERGNIMAKVFAAEALTKLGDERGRHLLDNLALKAANPRAWPPLAAATAADVIMTAEPNLPLSRAAVRWKR